MSVIYVREKLMMIKKHKVANYHNTFLIYLFHVTFGADFHTFQL